MMTLKQDVRYALRQLRRAPGFALTAVLTLALGVGANTAMVTIVRNTLLQPLPYPHQQELVGLDFEQPGQPAYDEQTGESADFLLGHARSFSSMGVADDGALGQNFSVAGGEPHAVRSLRVSSGYLPTLAIAPLLGRTFTPQEDTPGAAPTAVISETLWRSALAADPAVVGRVIHLNADPYTVIGVMPSALATVDAPDVWQPLHLSAADPGYGGDNFQMIARLRPGVTVAQASAEIETLNAALFRAFPVYGRWTKPGAPRLQQSVFPLRAVVASHARGSVLSLTAAVAAVLLMVCLNLGGLLIARSAVRRRDLAVRIALGASRAALLRLLMVENLMLALGGSVLGIALSSVLVPYLLRAAPIDLPHLHAFGTDLRSALFALALGVVAVAIFGLLPALQALGGAFARAGTPRIAGEGAPQQRMGKLLLVSQVALATMLLSVASLLLGTFLNMRDLHTGVEVPHLYAAQVSLHGTKFTSAQATQQFVSAVQGRLQADAGVAEVAAVNGLPLDRGLNNSGYPTGHPDLAGLIETRFVTPGYFSTVGTHLLAGQDISASDTGTAAPVALINLHAATRWFGTRSAIGEFVTSGGGKPRRIVGVVEDVRGQGIADAIRPTVYVPFAQIDDETASAINGRFSTTFVLRTPPGRAAAEPALLKAAMQAVNEADPQVPLGSLFPMQHYVDKSVAAPRFFSSVAMAFAVFAVLLTLIGTFGLLSYQVASRTREFGVRMALGSTREDVLLLVLGRGLLLTAAGLVIGVTGSIALRQTVRAFLVDSVHLAPASLAGVLASPSLSFAVSAVSVLFAATVAGLLPASRAASVNPTEALRSE